MADKTITQLTATTSAATADEIPIWVAGSAVARKITKANFLQGAFTGGGTVATGGYTLTVPATGTAALLATAQTFSALKTFSAGITFGNETMANYDIGTWTPALNFGGATTGITYSGQTGNYVRVGALVYVEMLMILTSKGSATGTATITGLPFTATAAASGMNPRYYTNLASMVGAPFGYIGGTTINLWQMGATSAAVLTNSNFANNTRLDMWGMYYV